MPRITVPEFTGFKAAGRKVAMVTAYDFTMARLVDSAGVEGILVGDSMSMVVQGHDSTLPVTLDQMIYHASSVVRAVKRALVVVDLPFGSYEAGAEQALATGVRFLKETGVSAVKLEGGRRVAAQIQALMDAGIPVVGHLGFTPQSENMLGGKRVQGRGDEAAEILCEDALALQEAGAVAVVLEMIPAPVAERVTEILHIPTIGIGAGAGCDGQVLVWLDMAGMGGWSPRFAKAFGQVGAALETAARSYVAEVRDGVFPAPEHTFDS